MENNSIEKIKLYDYQQQTLEKLIKSLANGNNKILVNIPTGGGKTILATQFIELCLNWDKKIIFCVDREELIKQTYNKFLTITNELSIVKSGMENMYATLAPIQIIGLQTYHARKPDLDCDILIIDEIHQGYGKSMQQGLINSFPNAKLIGLSATPIDEKGNLLPGFDDYINEVQTIDLIKKEKLAKPITYSPNICSLELENISMIGNDYNQKEIDDIVIDLEKVKNIVDQWELYAKDKKTLIFANSIKHAEMIFAEFLERDYINIDIIHSQIDNLAKKRQEIVSKQIIINCGILTTGYDDTEIEGIVLARPTAILRLYLQMIGRGLRINPKKKECIILDCAGCVHKHGLAEDLRFYSPKKIKKDEPLFKDCPECGNIESIHVKECSICNYNFELKEELSTYKKTKQQLEKLIKIKSKQQEIYEKLQELVKLRDYKSGFAWYLFKDLLINAKNQNTGMIFYNKILRRIEKCKTAKTKMGKPYSLKWLVYQ